MDQSYGWLWLHLVLSPVCAWVGWCFYKLMAWTHRRRYLSSQSDAQTDSSASLPHKATIDREDRIVHRIIELDLR